MQLIRRRSAQRLIDRRHPPRLGCRLRAHRPIAAGWTASFIELTFDGGATAPLKLTTDITDTPHTDITDTPDTDITDTPDTDITVNETRSAPPDTGA